VHKISRPTTPNRAPQNRGNPINDAIHASELRVIDEKGEQAGIMLLEVAQQMADNRKLDLVLISPNAKPPVAKIMDYGKYRYEQQKREKEARKKQKVIQVKEIRLSTFIEKHDLAVKAHNAEKFLKEGDKVKVSLRFKGRERGRMEKGYEVMERFAALTEEFGAPEKRPAFEGRSLTMILAPIPDKENKAAKSKNRDKSDAQEASEKQVAEKSPQATGNSVNEGMEQ
jgi:translation initiation factor IF-3